MIVERLEEAVKTLARLPPVKRPRLTQSRYEILRSAAERFGAAVGNPDYFERCDPDEILRRTPPSIEKIKEMDEALAWLMLIPDVQDRTIVWWRAEGRKWKEIKHRMALSRQQAWTRWAAAVLTIANKLNGATQQQSARAAKRARRQTSKAITLDVR